MREFLESPGSVAIWCPFGFLIGADVRAWAEEALQTFRSLAHRVAATLGARVNALSYLPKWLVLASIIGAIAGLGAVVFYETLIISTHLFLGILAGYRVPTPAGEGNFAGSTRYVRAWAIPIAVVLGALASGLLVFTWAPEAEGHGTDAAIDAVHRAPRGIRLRAVVIKIVASALTIGSGGSGGREGPTAQISAGFGSLLARVLDLSPEDGRIAVSVGIGSGIGAIFSAPLGGAVLAADIVYRDDFEFGALLPGMLASIVAYAIFGAVIGYKPMFAIPGGYRFHDPIQLAWFAVVGLLAGGVGLLYSKSFYGVARVAQRLPLPARFRPAFGGLLVGLMALALPQVLGTGYGWVQKGLDNQLLHAPLIVILGLPFARILATGLSIGTGGSGGVFGPGMVIGAFTGLAVWRVLAPLAPGVGHDPAPFVIVGMMAVFGGISRAPIAVMLMVVEMTGSIGVLGPAIVAVALSWFIVKHADDSIYRSQLHSRFDTTASRLQLGLPLLATMKVSSVMSPPAVVLRDSDRASEGLSVLESSGVPGAPVVDSSGTYLGTIDVDALSSAVENSPYAAVGQLVDVTTATVASDSALDVGLEALTQAGGRWVPVTDPRRRIVGILAVSDVVRGWRRALEANVGTISRVSARAVAIEERVGPQCPLRDHSLGRSTLPSGCVIITIQRDDQLQIATGETIFRSGDVVSALATPESVEDLRQLLRGANDQGLDEHHQEGGPLV